jgi:hypothetical protein
MDIDALHQELDEVFSEISALSTNYTKQGEGRRTRESVLNRLAKLEEFHNQLTALNDEAQIFRDTHPGHPYWRDRDSVMKLYTNFKTKLEAKLQSLPADSLQSQSTTAQTSTTASNQQDENGSNTINNGDSITTKMMKI